MIPRLCWHDAYRTGFRVIDNDHRMLVDILNSLIDETNRSRSTAHFGSTLRALETFTFEHNARLKHFLDQVDDPQIRVHAHQHRKLVQQVVQVAATFRHDPESLDLEGACVHLSQRVQESFAFSAPPA